MSKPEVVRFRTSVPGPLREVDFLPDVADYSSFTDCSLTVCLNIELSGVEAND